VKVGLVNRMGGLLLSVEDVIQNILDSTRLDSTRLDSTR
jgi:hypothetical protein